MPGAHGSPWHRGCGHCHLRIYLCSQKTTQPRGQAPLPCPDGGPASAGSAVPGQHGRALHLAGAGPAGEGPPPWGNRGTGPGLWPLRPWSRVPNRSPPSCRLRAAMSTPPPPRGTAVRSGTFHQCHEEGGAWLPDAPPRGSAHPTSMEARPLTFTSPWTGTSSRARLSGSPSARASAPPAPGLGPQGPGPHLQLPAVSPLGSGFTNTASLP